MSRAADWLNSRGSTRLGGSGLVVLGLGALVLLAGLSTPAPMGHDIVEATIRMAPVRHSMPEWSGGIAMIGVALVLVGTRRRAKALIQ